MTEMTIATVAAGTDVLAVVPQVMELARVLKGASGFIPEHLRTEGQIVAAILAGRELGFEPMAALRLIHVVKGKVGIHYSGMVALMNKRGYLIEWLESGPDRVVLKLTNPRGVVHVEKWDKARAMTAGLWNSTTPWQKYPETMLRARAISSAGFAFAAEVTVGVYSSDEVEEMQNSSASAKAAPAPVTGTDRLTAKLAAAGLPVAEVEVVKPAEVVAPQPMLLEEIIACFDAARDLAGLDACKDSAKQLTGSDLKAAREAYRARKAELEEAAAKAEEAANDEPPIPNF